MIWWIIRMDDGLVLPDTDNFMHKLARPIANSTVTTRMSVVMPAGVHLPQFMKHKQ